MDDRKTWQGWMHHWDDPEVRKAIFIRFWSGLAIAVVSAIVTVIAMVMMGGD